MWRIKWENILTIMMLTTMTILWVNFIYDSNVYNLAAAILSTFITLIIIMIYDTILEARKLLLNNCK